MRFTGLIMKLTVTEMMRHFDARAESSLTWPDTVFGNWHKAVHYQILDRAELDNSDVLLDLGCGTGWLAHQVAPHVKKVVAVDCSANSIALARSRTPARTNLDWHVGDLRNPPGVEGLTTVTLCHAVRYLDREERCSLFRKLHSRLSRDGLLVIGDILWSLDPSEIEGAEDWLDEDIASTIPVSEIDEDLKKAGFWPWIDRVHPAMAVIRAARLERPRERS